MSNLLDHLVETLRATEPRPAAVDRAVSALQRPHPTRFLPLTVGVAAVSAIMLWPRPGSGLAWAQIAAQDLPPRYHQKTVLVSKGVSRPFIEIWVDRPADAARSRDTILMPGRSPKADLATAPGQIWEVVRSPKGQYRSWNDVAAFTRKTHPHGPFDPRDRGGRIDLESFLEMKDLQQLGVDRSVQTRVGLADRYRLDLPHREYDPATKTRRETRRDGYEVFVQPGTKRVLGYDLVGLDLRSETTIEYPDRFPAETFSIPPEGRLNVYDLDAIDEAARRRLKTPIATLKAGGQTSVLRLVVQGAKHELWTLWTGGKPNGDLAQRVQVLGIANGAAYGLADFTAKSKTRVPYGGHAVILSRRVDEVDLRIPVFAAGSPRSRFKGDATVRRVPVLQVSDFRDVCKAMGVEDPVR